MGRRRKKVEVEVEPPRRRHPPKDTTAGEAHEFIKAIHDLRGSIERLDDHVVGLTRSIKAMDEHNAALYDALERLSARLDLINGVGSLFKKLLPGRRV